MPDRIRPGMSSTVNIITETIKDALSIPIQALTSRSDDYNDIDRSDKEQEKEVDNENDSFKKVKSVDVVFTLEDIFKGDEAEEGKKYVIVNPVKVGISGENYYEVLSGLEEEQMIVVGGYKALSKLLNHGDLVKIRD